MGYSALCRTHYDLMGKHKYCEQATQSRKRIKCESATEYRKELSTNLWESKLHTDCTVAVNGHETQCHRAVLAAASPVFQRMPVSGMQEANDCRIGIADAEPDVVTAMLHFVYVGELPEESENLDKLIVLADKYDIPMLVEYCAEHLLDAMTSGNAPQIARVLRNFSRHLKVEPLWISFLEQVALNQELLRVTLEGI